MEDIYKVIIYLLFSKNIIRSTTTVLHTRGNTQNV